MGHTSQELWTTFRQRLEGFLRNRVSPDAVEDLRQEVFLRIHRGLVRGDLPENPSAWVFRVARNAVVDHYRRRRLDAELPERLSAESVTDEQVLSEEDALGELSECVRPMVDALPDTYREALTLTHLDGASQVDAARRLGISVSGMKSRVQRGRRLLTQSLLDCCHLEFDARGRPVDCDCRAGCRAC